MREKILGDYLRESASSADRSLRLLSFFLGPNPMSMFLSRTDRIVRRVLVAVGNLALPFITSVAWSAPDPYPSVPAEHRHVRMLLENALRYASPENKIVDPVSGYPFEGWNQDPKQGLFLRSFTQLTAIGQWMELLANFAAG